MSKPESQELQEPVPQEPEASEAESLRELRSLLVGPEQIQIEQLQGRLENPQVRAQDVSQVLPEAIVLRSGQDKKLAAALTPTVEESLRSAIQKNRATLAEVLFPIMGPAIRKAITESLRSLLQSLNEILEHSFSWQSLQWRLEARRTKRPFAEIVLIHSLIYRVEQVFLIHRETGLLLEQVVNEPSLLPDADLVSSMLTAIKDFMGDLFHAHEQNALETIQFGEFTLWIEEGPQAILAAVIKGTAPEKIRSEFRESLELIHLDQGEALSSFQGDTAPFEAARPHLEDCLLKEFQPGKKKTSPLVPILLGGLLLLVGVWVTFTLLDHWRWSDFVTKLRSQPGIVVTSTGKKQGKYLVTGLRDPLAVEPQVILTQNGFEPDAVVFQWQPFQSLDPSFTLKRIKKFLDPPSTVALRLKNGTLHASGSAPQQWIVEARKLVRAIPGVEAYRDNDLSDATLVELKALTSKVDQLNVLFTSADSEIKPEQQAQLLALAKDIRKLQALAPSAGRTVRIKIIGHSDKSGSKEKNKELSQARALQIKSFLLAKGISPRILSILGAGTSQPRVAERTERAKEMNRRVSFQVVLGESNHPAQ